MYYYYLFANFDNALIGQLTIFVFVCCVAGTKILHAEESQDDLHYEKS